MSLQLALPLLPFPLLAVLLFPPLPASSILRRRASSRHWRLCPHSFPAACPSCPALLRLPMEVEVRHSAVIVLAIELGLLWLPELPLGCRWVWPWVFGYLVRGWFWYAPSVVCCSPRCFAGRVWLDFGRFCIAVPFRKSLLRIVTAIASSSRLCKLSIATDVTFKIMSQASHARADKSHTVPRHLLHDSSIIHYLMATLDSLIVVHNTVP